MIPWIIGMCYYNDYAKELTFKPSNIVSNAWEKSTFGPMVSSKPVYKAPEYKYGEGN